MTEPASPIFVLAAPFSGTSWLAGVLGQHPQLYALPQLFPFVATDVGEWLDVLALSQGDHADGVRRAVAEVIFGGQRDEHIDQAEAWLRERQALSVKTLIDHLAAAVAPRRLVIPDSEAALRPTELLRLRAAYPAAPIVHLVRHPWSQGCRLAAWLRVRLFVPVDFRDYGQSPPLPEPQIPWLRANQNLERFAAAQPSQLHRLQAESLDTDFAAAITALCGWLGLEHPPAALAAMAEPQHWPFAQPGPAAARGGLEAEVWDDVGAEAEALAAAPRLDAPLPWRGDGSGFDPQLRARAERYGYR